MVMTCLLFHVVFIDDIVIVDYDGVVDVVVDDGRDCCYCVYLFDVIRIIVVDVVFCYLLLMYCGNYCDYLMMMIDIDIRVDTILFIDCC
jgi:hypothetical protein